MGYFWDPSNKKVKKMMKTTEKGVLKTTAAATKGGEAFLSGFAMPHVRPEEVKINPDMFMKCKSAFTTNMKVVFMNNKCIMDMCYMNNRIISQIGLSKV